MTPDRALIYSILAGGVSAFNSAKQKGITSELLLDEEALVFKLCEHFVIKGRMPTLEEIELAIRVKLPPYQEQLDPEMCSEIIAKRTLMTKLNDGIGAVIDQIIQDPYKAREKLAELIYSTVPTGGSLRRTNSSQTIEEIEKRYLDAENRKGGLLGLSSPWPSRDKRSRGLQNGELCVIMAKRKNKKTFLGLSWIDHIWKYDLKPGEKALVITMEMPVWQMNQRLFAIHTKTPYALFRSGTLPYTERTRFLEWCQDMKQSKEDRPEVICVGSDIIKNVGDIVAIGAQYRPKVIFVDGFYILGKDSGIRNMWERTLNNVQAMKLDLAAGLNVPVITTTQLNAQAGKDDLDSEADAAAYAKAIGDYADTIDGIFSDNEFKLQKKAILRGMEAREFEPIDLQIHSDLDKMDFSEVKVLNANDDLELDVSDDIGMSKVIDDDEELKF